MQRGSYRAMSLDAGKPPPGRLGGAGGGLGVRDAGSGARSTAAGSSAGGGATGALA